MILLYETIGISLFQALYAYNQVATCCGFGQDRGNVGDVDLQKSGLHGGSRLSLPTLVHVCNSRVENSTSRSLDFGVAHKYELFKEFLLLFSRDASLVCARSFARQTPIADISLQRIFADYVSELLKK